MNVKLFLIATLISVLLELGTAQEIPPDCPRRCNRLARCTPYYEDLVWSVVEGTCRVFKNGCIFGSVNCQRVNSCQEAHMSTTREKCMSVCVAASCERDGSGVCGWFSFTNSDGTTGGYYKSFANLCQLNYYACSNANAYVGAPILGACPNVA